MAHENAKVATIARMGPNFQNVRRSLTDHYLTMWPRGGPNGRMRIIISVNQLAHMEPCGPRGVKLACQYISAHVAYKDRCGPMSRYGHTCMYTRDVV
jgi:hypothetical protein